MPRKKNTVAKIGKRVVSFADDGVPYEIGHERQQHVWPGRGPSARGPPVDQVLTTHETAEFLHVSASSLNKWRLQGRGPCFVYVGRCVRYRATDIAAYLEGRCFNSTSSAAAATNTTGNFG